MEVLQAHSSSTSQSKGYSCHFAEKGCTRIFKCPNALNEHKTACMYGLLSVCRRDGCEGLLPFQSPYDLVRHSVEMHECIHEEYDEFSFVFTYFKPPFLRPSSSNTNAAFAYFYNLAMDTTPIDVTLAILCQRNQQYQREVMLVPVQINNPPNDHYLRFHFKVFGGSSLQGIPAQNSTGVEFSTLAFHSEVECLRALEKSCCRIPRYPVSLIDPNLVNYEGTHVPGIFIRASIDRLRCVLNHGNAGQIARYAIKWSDLRLSNGLQGNMTDGTSHHPSPHTCIIVPQIQKGINVMIESKDTTECLNAISVGIIDGITKSGGNSLERPLIPYCKALVLTPTSETIRNIFFFWNSHGAGTSIQFQPLPNASERNLELLKGLGADVVFTTPALILHVMKSGDHELWNLLTHQLKYIFIYQSDQMCLSAIKNFAQALGPKLQTITKIVFGNHIDTNTEERLKTHLFNAGAQHISVGPRKNNA